MKTLPHGINKMYAVLPKIVKLLTVFGVNKRVKLLFTPPIGLLLPVNLKYRNANIIIWDLETCLIAVVSDC